MFVIKKNHFKVCYPRVGKKVREIGKDEPNEPSNQSDYEFVIETINIRNSAYIKQIKNDNSDWSITLPSNGTPVSYKIDTETQCNVPPLTILKKFDPEPDLCPVNIKLTTHNISKIPVLGKCSPTLNHKKYHFHVSFIVVDSKTVPIQGLSTGDEQLVMNVSDEQFLSEFPDCFGEIGNPKNTHYIEIMDNATSVGEIPSL